MSFFGLAGWEPVVLIGGALLTLLFVAAVLFGVYRAARAGAARGSREAGREVDPPASGPDGT